MYVFLGFLEGYGFGVARGGAGKLTDALIACIREHGGEVLANAEVARIKVSQRARQLVSKPVDGRSFAAKDAVIGAIHPHLLGGMIDGMDARARADAEATHITSAACITVHAALSEPLRFRTRQDTVNAVMVEMLPTSYETLRRDFDELRYGQFLPYPLLGLGSLSQFDPSRVPAGQGHPAPVGLRALQATRWSQLGREQAGIRQADAGAPVEVRREHSRRGAAGPCGQPRGHGTHLARASGAATCTASPPPPIKVVRTAPHRSWANYTVPGLDRFYLVGSVPVSPVAACSARDAPRP